MAKIPTTQQIIDLYAEFHTPPHVREHCGMVSYLATEIGKKFIAKGIFIDLELLKAASLLHDLVRVIDFRVFDPSKFPFKPTEADIIFWKELRERYAGKHHAMVGAEILEQKGFPEVAMLVKKHRFLQIETGFAGWEEKILYYADKRVKHATIVSLRERLEEGRLRNAPDTMWQEKSKDLDNKVYALEREIFSALGVSRLL